MLVIIALVIVSIDMLIVTIGTSIPETRLVATTTADTLHDDTNIEYTVSSCIKPIILISCQYIQRDAILYQHYTYVCTVSNSLVWVGLSFGYKGLLQIVAMFMAFHTRRVKIAALNDSKEIAVIIYINSIILIVMAGSEFVLEHYHNAHSALFGLALLIQATMFLGVLFIPNVSITCIIGLEIYTCAMFCNSCCIDITNPPHCIDVQGLQGSQRRQCNSNHSRSFHYCSSNNTHSDWRGTE